MHQRIISIRRNSNFLTKNNSICGESGQQVESIVDQLLRRRSLNLVIAKINCHYL